MKKVFVVEDNTRLAPKLIEALADSCEVLLADLELGMDHILDQIKDFSPDVVLLDHYLDQNFYGSTIRKNISGIKTISISTEEQDYCDEYWGKKQTLYARRPTPDSIQAIEELKEVICE